MNRFLNNVGFVFLGLLAVAVAGIWAVQALWINPGQRCEAGGNWWDPSTRICGHVVYLPDITHRPAGAKAPFYPALPKSRDEAADAASVPSPPAPAATPVRR